MRPTARGALGSLLCFSLFDCGVRVHCEDAEAGAWLAGNYVLGSDLPAPLVLDYRIDRQRKGAGWSLQRSGRAAVSARTAEELLFRFEETLLLDLQRARPDLYFLHAAVVESAGRACLVIAPSGGGKSLTTWALLQEGWGYGSDEVGAVDLRRLCVYPYPHALCVKQEPPPPYSLPQGVRRTASRLYIPPAVLPARVHQAPLPLTDLCFVHYCPQAPSPVLQPVSTAEAGTRLFANTLNALAHEGAGLDGAIAIATSTRKWRLQSADLKATARLLHTQLACQSQRHALPAHPSGAAP